MKRTTGWWAPVIVVAALSACGGAAIALWCVAGRPEEPSSNEYLWCRSRSEI